MNDNNNGYWKANLRLLGILLSIWFTVSFGFGILLVEELNQIPFFGFKLGFWWAQQGAIYVFVALIFVYIHLMQKLDRQYGVSDDEDESSQQEDDVTWMLNRSLTYSSPCLSAVHWHCHLVSRRVNQRILCRRRRRHPSPMVWPPPLTG